MNVGRNEGRKKRRTTGKREKERKFILYYAMK